MAGLADIYKQVEAGTYDPFNLQPTETNTYTKPDGVYDADTYYQDGQGYRIEGIDAPEIPTKALKLQRLMKAKENKLGRFVSRATAGEAAKLEAELSVLDANGIDSGFKETHFDDSMNTPVYQETPDYDKVGIFGRPITENEAYQNKLVSEGYAVPAFEGQTPEGKSLMLNAKKYGRGLWGSPDTAGEMSKTAVKRGALPEPETADEGMMLESLDIAQSSLIQQYGKSSKALRDTSRWLLGKVADKDTVDKWLPSTDKVGTLGFGETAADELVDRDVADSIAGVSAQSRAEQSAGMKSAEDAIAKGDYLEAGWNAFKILPYMLGDSTGEIANMMIPGAGLPTTVLARVNEDAEAYEEANGKKPDTNWFLGSIALNAAAIGSEKFLIRSGIGGLMKKGATKLGKLGGVTASALGEAIQETFDQTQQTYMTQKEGDRTIGEIVASDETKLAAITGGVMGGALRAGGEAVKAVPKAVAKVAKSAGSKEAAQEVVSKIDQLKAEIDRRKAEKAKEIAVPTEAPKTTVDIEAAAKTAMKDVKKARELVAKARTVMTENRDEVEMKVKNIATNLVDKGQDDLNILGSDLDEAEKAKRVQELIEFVTEDKELSPETRDELVKRLGSTFGGGADTIVAKAEENGQARRALKSTAQVGQEVTTGPRGFLTFYNEALNAKAAGDAEVADGYIAKLENLLNNQETKRAAIKSLEAEILRDFEGEAELKAKKEGTSIAAARKALENRYRNLKRAGKGSKKTTYGTQGEQFELYVSTVLEKQREGEGFGKGAYKTISAIDNEILAMKTLYADITDAEVETAPTPMKKPEKKTVEKPKEEAVPKRTVKNATVEELGELLDTLQPRYDILVSKLAEGTATESERQEAFRFERIVRLRNAKLEESKEVEEVDIPDDLPVDAETDFVVPADVPTAVPDTSPDMEMPNEVPGEIDVEVAEPDFKVPTEFDPFMETEVPMEKYQPITTIKADTATKEKLETIYTRIEKLKDKREELEADVDDTRTIDDQLDKYEAMLDGSETRLQEEIETRIRKLWGGLGYGSTTLKDVFKVKTATVLNSADIELDKDIEGLVQGALQEAAVTKKGIVNQNDSADDMARALLYRNDGTIDPNVATALYKGMMSYVVENSGDLARRPELEDVQKMLPFTKKLKMDDPVDVETMLGYMDFFNDGGKLLKFEAESIGDAIVADLGIVPTDGNETNIQGLKASLGGMAVLMGTKAGWMRPAQGLKVPGQDQKVAIVKVNRRAIDALDKAREELSHLEEAYDADRSKRKTYTLVQPGKKQASLKNMPYADATELQSEMRNKLSQTEYKANSGITIMIEMFGDDKDALKEALGYKDKIVLEKMFYDKRQAVTSVNREIDVKVDELYEMLERTRTDEEYRSVWFDYFVAKNGRESMNSITVNPQVDKQLARWTVTPTDANITLSKKKVQNADGKDAISFLYGVVQAFEGNRDVPSIDKSFEADIIAKGLELVKMSDKELKDMVTSADHKGHAMLAIGNIRKFQGDGKWFSSDMVTEYDGLTNGLAFKFVQFALNSVMTLLPKVGVIRNIPKNEELWKYDSISEIKANKGVIGFLDVYETIGESFTRPKLTGKLKKIEGLLGNALINTNDKAKLRGLAKDPVMVTGYSAGEVSTKANIVKVRLEALMADINDGKLTDEQLAELVKPYNGTVEGFKKLAMEKSIYAKEFAAFRTDMSEFFYAYYADPMYNALDKVLGEVKEVGDLVTTSYDFMYDVMVKEYDKRVNELMLKEAKNNVKKLPTREQKIEILKDLLKEVGPFVRSSESKTDTDKIAVLSRSIIDIQEEIEKYTTKKQAENAKIGVRVKMTDTELANVQKDAKTLGVRMIMRTFGAPGAAGGVLQTHTEDNHTMARVLTRMEKSFNQVFDAMVLGAGQTDAVTMYNEEFWKLNKDHSMLGAVMEALEKAYKHPEGKTVRKRIGKKWVNGEMLYKALGKYRKEIDRNREKLFAENVKIGQMVGPKGFMYEANKIPEVETAGIQQEDGIISKNENITVAKVLQGTKDCK